MVCESIVVESPTEIASTISAQKLKLFIAPPSVGP